jgi:hypothetical protein
MSNDYYVYILQRADGTPFYVGKGRHRRIDTTRDPRNGNNKHKKHILLQLLSTLGYVPYTLEREDLSNEEASLEEIRIIAFYGRKPAGILVNMTDGGDGVTKLTSEVHERRRQKMMGNKNGKGTTHSPETREKQRQAKLGNAWNRGRKKSPEHIAKIAEANARWRDTEIGKETMLRISQGHIGRKLSEESKARIRAARAKQVFSPETLAKMKKTPEQRARHSLAMKEAYRRKRERRLAAAAE